MIDTATISRRGPFELFGHAGRVTLVSATAGAELVRPLTAAPDLDGWAVVEQLLDDLAPPREQSKGED